MPHVPSGGLVRDGQLLLDFHAFPLRIKENPEGRRKRSCRWVFPTAFTAEAKAELRSAAGSASTCPTWWKSTTGVPAGNPGKPRAGGIWIWGYDEITWFAHQSKKYRNEWLQYAWDWVRKTDPNGYLQMPGSRTCARRWTKSAGTTPTHRVLLRPEGYGQEETIRAIWAADLSPGFTGEKTAWHGFDRYDFLMDEAELTIKPIKAAPDEKNGIKGQVKGQLRCVMVVPKEAAPGNPWSWRGYYFDHEPQAEIELLKRGFHIGYHPVRCRQAMGRLVRIPHRKAWPVQKAGLYRHEPGRPQRLHLGHCKSRQGFLHLRRQSRDQPGSLMKLGELAQNDVPLLHVCGSLDPILGNHTLPVESIYQQLGGRISVMIKDGAGHHPHSLRDPTPIADFIVPKPSAGRR